MPYTLAYHVTTRIVPETAYHFPEHSLYIFPSVQTCSLMQQFEGSPALGLLFYQESDLFPPQHVNDRLRDVITILSVFVVDPEPLLWLTNHWLDIREQAKTPLFVTDTEAAVEELRTRDTFARNPVQIILNFEHCYIPSIARDPCAYSIRSAISNYLRLDDDDQLKHHIETLAFASNSHALLSSVYNNENLGPSLLWTLVDAIMPKEIVERRTSCTNCGGIMISKQQMPTSERIKLFVEKLPLESSDRSLVQLFLMKLNRFIRNPFYHAGKKGRTVDDIEALTSKLGRSHFTARENIEHADGRLSGVPILEYLLRRHFMEKLDAVVVPSDGRARADAAT